VVRYCGQDGSQAATPPGLLIARSSKPSAALVCTVLHAFANSLRSQLELNERGQGAAAQCGRLSGQ